MLTGADVSGIIGHMFALRTWVGGPSPVVEESMLVDPALCTPLPDVPDALDRPDQAAAALTLLAPAADTHRPLELLRPAGRQPGGPRGGEARPPGESRAAVRRAVAAFARQTQAERHAAAFADRKVVQSPEEDGMASIWLPLAADGAAPVMPAITACA